MRLFTRTNTSTTKKTLNIYRDEIRKERKSFWTGMLLVPLTTFLSIVLVPLLISFVIQGLVENAPIAYHLWLLAGIVISSIIYIAANHIGFRELFMHEERVITRLMDRAMDRLLDHSQMFFSNQKIGSLANDVNSFSRSYLSLLDTISMQLMGILVSYITSLVIVCFLAPLLLIPLVSITAFVVWHSTAALNERSIYRNKRKELQSGLLGIIADILGNQSLVRLFDNKSSEMATIISKRKEIVDIADKEITQILRSQIIRQAVLTLFQIITVGLIIYMFSKDLIGVGAAIFVITYLVRVTSTVFNITGIIRTIEQSFLDAAKVTEMLDEVPDIRDAKSARDIVIKRGDITYDNVDFRYSDAKHERIFKNLNLQIQHGTTVGLVGKSGSGKTTLTSLLLRLNDVDKGKISIDGADISEITQGSLRRSIAYVPQDPFMFHRTLRENISYGSLDATEADIVKAAKKAHAWEFIQKLPDALNTVVGERGVKLSGGQRQRIAIARAILKDAPILLLDEATSALDSESERYIQDALSSLMKNRTSIVIAHRLSTIAKLDRIIVLDDGEIVEDGSHEELLSKNGTYAKLWSHQSGGFLEE